MRPRPHFGSRLLLLDPGVLPDPRRARPWTGIGERWRLHLRRLGIASDVSRASPESATSPSRVYIADARVRKAAQFALQIASTQAATRRCQRVLSEFVDGGQQPLIVPAECAQAASAGVRAHGGLRRGRGPPRLPRVRAGSHHAREPRRAPVRQRVCGRRRTQPRRGWSAGDARGPALPGPRESPPSPAFISRRVRELCW